MSISRYIVAAVVRCSRACLRLPVRRQSLPLGRLLAVKDGVLGSERQKEDPVRQLLRLCNFRDDLQIGHRHANRDTQLMGKDDPLKM